MPGLAWCIALVAVQTPEATPSAFEPLGSDPNLTWFLLVPMLLAAYYFAAIYWIRRSNALDTVVTQYSPPLNLSPAAIRYALTGEIDEKGVAGCVVHLAARKLVRFHGLDNYYTVSRTDTPLPADLAPDERAVYEKMFNLDTGGTGPFAGRLRTYDELPHDTFLLPPVDEKNFVLLADTIEKTLKNSAGQEYYTPNLRYIAPAEIASVFFLLVPVLNPVLALFAAAGFTIVARFFVRLPDELVRVSARRKEANLLAVRAIFLAVCLGALGALGAGSSAYALSLVAVLSLNLFLAPHLRSRTELGLELVAKIEGYRDFLEEVELDRMQRMKTPEWVPTTSTEYLAYALALELGNAWQDYLSNSGYWIAETQPSKLKKMVRVRARDTLFDAWLAFCFIMLVFSGICLAVVRAFATDASVFVVPEGTIAACYGIAFLVFFLVYAFRSR